MPTTAEPGERLLGSEDFAQLTDPLRPELLAYCYRMLGSVHDAEDQVQETIVRAWRSYGSFEGRSSLRTWLYRIATNTCLRALEGRRRRPLPAGLGGPADAPEGPLDAARPEVPWLEPFPDTLLGVSTAAVNSVLQRARAGLQQAALVEDEVREPADADQRALLEKYATAFENADVNALMRLLRADAVVEMPPIPTWFAGREQIGRFLAAHVLRAPGDFRTVLTGANGQPALAAYLREPDGIYRAHVVQVLTCTSAGPAGIAGIVAFTEPGLFPAFGLPPELQL